MVGCSSVYIAAAAAAAAWFPIWSSSLCYVLELDGRRQSVLVQFPVLLCVYYSLFTLCVYNRVHFVFKTGAIAYNEGTDCRRGKQS